MSGSSNGANGKTPINLDDLTTDAGTVIIDGEERRVVQLDGPGWLIYDRMRGIIVEAREGKAPPNPISTEEFYRLTERCLPDTPKDVVWGLTPSKAGIVIGIAAGTLESVEESAPKADAPTKGKTRKRRSPSSA
jgi:hypothetical protein